MARSWAGSSDGWARAVLATTATAAPASRARRDVRLGLDTRLSLQWHDSVADQSPDAQQAQARVQKVAQAVAQHVEAQHRQGDGQPWPDGELGRLEDVGLGVAQHAAP